MIRPTNFNRGENIVTNPGETRNQWLEFKAVLKAGESASETECIYEIDEAIGGDTFVVKQPTGLSLDPALLVYGTSSAEAGETFTVSKTWPAWVQYSSDSLLTRLPGSPIIPPVGATVGTNFDSYYLDALGTGFLVLGVDPDPNDAAKARLLIAPSDTVTPNRYVFCINGSEEVIPPYSVMEVQSVLSFNGIDIYIVGKPLRNDIDQVLFNEGIEIPISGGGYFGTIQPLTKVRLEPGSDTPQIGDTVGAVLGQWYVKKGNSGLISYGTDVLSPTWEEYCLVRPFRPRVFPWYPVLEFKPDASYINPLSFAIRQSKFGSDFIFAIAEDGINNTNYYSYSEDGGKTWTDPTVLDSSIIVIKYEIAEDRSIVAYSRDRANPRDRYIYHSSDFFASKTNVSSQFAPYAPENDPMSFCHAGNNRWVLGKWDLSSGPSSKIYTSTDGINWTPRRNVNRIYNVAWVGGNTICFTEDGVDGKILNAFDATSPVISLSSTGESRITDQKGNLYPAVWSSIITNDIYGFWEDPDNPANPDNNVFFRTAVGLFDAYGYSDDRLSSGDYISTTRADDDTILGVISSRICTASDGGVVAMMTNVGICRNDNYGISPGMA